MQTKNKMETKNQNTSLHSSLGLHSIALVFMTHNSINSEKENFTGVLMINKYAPKVLLHEQSEFPVCRIWVCTFNEAFLTLGSMQTLWWDQKKYPETNMNILEFCEYLGVRK